MKPKLRFADFSDDYIESKLKNYVEVYDGTHETPNYVDSGIKFVSVENIKNLLNSDKYIPEIDFDKYKIKPKYNDVFMTRIGDIGTSTIYKSNEPLAYYVSLALLRSKNESVLYPDYLNQYISNQDFQKELHDRTIHVAFPKKINTGEIGECNIKIPSYKEQIKVSNFLSLLDKKIELQSKKIEDLKLFKLCIMKEIFTSNNANTLIKIKDVAKIEKGKQINGDLLLEHGNYYMLNGGINPSGYLNEYNRDENTITISEGGNSCGYVSFNKSKFWCGGHCYSVSPDEINNEYLYQILKYNEKAIMDLRVGSGLPNIQKKDIENFRLNIHNNKEQNDIAMKLSKYDYKIELEEKYLIKLQSLKKGLMQNMFV